LERPVIDRGGEAVAGGEFDVEAREFFVVQQAQHVKEPAGDAGQAAAGVEPEDVFPCESFGLREEHPGFAGGSADDGGAGDFPVQRDGRARAVVAGEQAGRNLGLGRCGGAAGVADLDAERTLKGGPGDGPGTQQAGGARVAEVHDGGLKADGARAAVEDVADFPAEAGRDVRGGGRADIAEGIGAGRGERHAGELEQAAEERMARHAHGHARQAGRDDVGHNGLLRQDEGERAGPEFPGQSEGGSVGHGDGGELGEGMDVDDERVVHRPALGGENLPAGARVESVGGETVDGLGRHGDEFTGLEGPREPGEIGRSAAINPGGGCSHGLKGVRGKLKD
jgi:hypothetical protein